MSQFQISCFQLTLLLLYIAIPILCSRIRPVNIINYRNNEALCILRDNNENESLEWIDVENVIDIGDFVNDNEKSNDVCAPTIDNLKSWLQSPWQEEVEGNSSEA